MPLPGPPAEKEAPPPMSVLSTHRGTSASSFQPTPSKASAKCEIGSSEASRTSPPVYALAVLCGGAPPAALPNVACARLTSSAWS